MSYYPALLDLSGKKAVVIGGGAVAQRKIETLIECGAIVHVISRDMTPELQGRLKKGDIRFLSHEFDDSLIEGAFLVIIATDDVMMNQRISEIAKKRNILVNVVDQPDECSFIVPSILKRGDLIIAVSTSGKSPALAKRIREKLADLFGKEYESFLLFMGKIRKELLLKDIPEDERGRIFHELVDSPVLDLIKRKDYTGVAKNMERILNTEISVNDIIKYLRGE